MQNVNICTRGTGRKEVLLFEKSTCNPGITAILILREWMAIKTVLCSMIYMEK